MRTWHALLDIITLGMHSERQYEKPETKEITMNTLDLSPAMIGKLIEITSPSFRIGGELQDFNFEPSPVDIKFPHSPDQQAVLGAKHLTATIAGIKVNLDGHEQLAIVE